MNSGWRKRNEKQEEQIEEFASTWKSQLEISHQKQIWLNSREFSPFHPQHCISCGMRVPKLKDTTNDHASPPLTCLFPCCWQEPSSRHHLYHFVQLFFSVW